MICSSMLSRAGEAGNSLAKPEQALGEKAEALLQKRKYNLVLVSSTNLDSIMEFFQHTPKGMHFICDTYQVEVILTAMRGMEPMGNYL